MLSSSNSSSLLLSSTPNPFTPTLRRITLPLKLFNLLVFEPQHLQPVQPLPSTSPPHLINRTHPQVTATMIAETNLTFTSEHFTDEKHETRKWLSRCLRKNTSRPGKEIEVVFHSRLQVHEVSRPQTAPSSGVARPLMPSTMEPTLPAPRPRKQPPPRPPRPDSDVIRDVNAWLDASMHKPAPQLMGGIPYWREGPFTTGAGPSADVRYAIPIAHTQLSARPTASHGDPVKSFCRRAKKMHVRMPSLLRTGSQRVSVLRRKQQCRRSTSMQLLALTVEDLPSPAYRSLARYGSLMNMTDRSSPPIVSSQEAEWMRAGRAQFHAPSPGPRLASSAGSRFDDQEASMERHVNEVFGQTVKRGDILRPMTASRGTREDSFGNLSDAPTYFTGPPPPSYRSRAASIRTTSSFGCVDGMNRSQQQISQPRSSNRNRGVRGKFRKLAQKARINI